ncbi:MAG: hypothetical protein M3O30_17380 [Planctomycetota bacterium]|nr:hypothetical protein [Planctomycetota bacterium]
MPKPGDVITKIFNVASSAGAAVNFDSAPAAIVNRNGTDDGTVAVVITNLDTGRYKSVFTIPLTYSFGGDSISLCLSGLVGGVTVKATAGPWFTDNRVNDIAFNGTSGNPNVNVVSWLSAAPNALQAGNMPATDSAGNAIATATNLATLLTRLPQTIAFNGTSGNPNVNLVSWLGTAPLALASQLVQAQTANYLGPTAGQIAASVQSLGGITFTSVSPLAQNGSLTIVHGDDYYNVDNRAISFNATAGAWPNLTGAAVALDLRVAPSNTGSGATSEAISGVVSASGVGVGQSVYFEISSAITGALAVWSNGYTYAVIATLSDGHVATLATGSVTVKAAP